MVNYHSMNNEPTTKILIAYSTLTNNTADAATALHESLRTDFPARIFELLNIIDITIAQFANYDLVIFGSPTWDDGPTGDTEALLQNLEATKPDLSGQKFALFGLGDKSYEPFFCASIYEVKKQFEKYGAHVFADVHTIDGYPIDTLLAELAQWGKTVIANINKI